MSRGMGSAIAMIGSFRAALATTGIGLFVIALGFLISKLIKVKSAQSEVNEKMQEYIDLQNQITENSQTYENRESLNLRQRKELLDKLLENYKQIEDQINKELKPAAKGVKEFNEAFNPYKIKEQAAAFSKSIPLVNLQLAQKKLLDIGNKIKTLKKENPGLENFSETTNAGDQITKIESAAPKVFNINITKLVDTFNVNSATLKEGSADIKQRILETLLGAVNDVQITANV